MSPQAALDQIAAVRQSVARAHSFSGYRAASTACTGFIAILTSAVSQILLDHGVFSDNVFLGIWIAAAAASLVVVGVEMTWRLRRSRSVLQRDLTMAAIERFLPPIAAGGLLTLVIIRFSPLEAWMLPGLWMILFGLAVHASRRLLPRYSEGVAAFYLFSGLLVLALREQTQFSPWPMGIVFGLGQFFAAAMLRNTERSDAV